MNTLDLKTKRKISRYIRLFHSKRSARSVRFGPDGAVSYVASVMISGKPIRVFAGWDGELFREMEAHCEIIKATKND